MKSGSCQLFTEQERDYIEKNYYDIGGEGCALTVKGTAKQIHGYARRKGLKVSKEKRLFSIRKQRKFKDFKIDTLLFTKNFTKESAYILGLIWADGHIANKNKHSIVFTSTNPDAEYFLKIFNVTGEWGVYLYKDKKHPTWKEKVTITTCNREIVTFLKNNDYHIKKTVSPCKILSKIPKELHRYWFLGLSDGDGYFRKHPKHNAYQWTVTSNIEQDWIYLVKMSEELKIPHYKTNQIKSKNKKNNCSRFVLCSRESVKILASFLYKEYIIDNIGLPRKFEIVKNLCQSESYSPEIPQHSN